MAFAQRHSRRRDRARVARFLARALESSARVRSARRRRRHAGLSVAVRRHPFRLALAVGRRLPRLRQSRDRAARNDRATVRPRAGVLPPAKFRISVALSIASRFPNLLAGNTRCDSGGVTMTEAARVLATEASPTTYHIMGREVRLPVLVRDADALMAYYLVSTAAAQRLVDPSGLAVAAVLPGRALCTIGTMNYRDNDLGQYYEIAITFYVRERGQRSLPLIGTMLDFQKGRVGAYIHHLPVNGEFTCAAGNEIWGFPKSVCDIRLSQRGGKQTTVWNKDGR